MSTIKRLVEVTDVPSAEADELEWLFKQMASINNARNKLLHYGAINVPEGNPSVTNAIKALTEDRIEYFPISPAILDDMSEDLRKIIIRITLNHLGRPKLSPATLKMMEKVLQNTWRYKHQRQKLEMKKVAENSPANAPRGG